MQKKLYFIIGFAGLMLVAVLLALKAPVKPEKTNPTCCKKTIKDCTPDEKQGKTPCNDLESLSPQFPGSNFLIMFRLPS